MFPENKKVMMCYYTNWSQYRPDDGKFTPEHVDPFLCTHILYSFAKVNKDKIEAYEWNDESTEWSEGNYNQVSRLKEINPDLKVLLAVGGWNHGSGPFSDMANDDRTRKSFIKNAVYYLKEHKFDGLDLGIVWGNYLRGIR